ncbi:MAG: hypothetical protein ACXWMO_10050 [Syntrophales bacterium]
MAEKRTLSRQFDSTHHLKSIFEQSLAVLCRDGDKDSATGNGQNGRVRCDSLPLHMDAANLEKRALDDAAKALATLWKISDAGRPKLQARGTHSDRQIH